MSEIILKQLAPRGYLRAAINLSNFLLVTGKEANGDPQGVSPDMARALAHELGVDIELISFSRPGELADAIFEDKWDIGNIANEPERAKSITFSLPYTSIESTFLLRKHLNFNTIKGIDQEGIRIDESFSIFQENQYEVLAGLRPKLTDDVKKTKDCLILDESFTYINQCIGSKPNNLEAASFINKFIKKNIKNGFIKSLLIKYNVLGKLSLPKN